MPKYNESQIEEATGNLQELRHAKEEIARVIGLMEAGSSMCGNRTERRPNYVRNDAGEYVTDGYKAVEITTQDLLDIINESIDEHFHHDIERAKEVLQHTGDANPMTDREIEMMRGEV